MDLTRLAELPGAWSQFRVELNREFFGANWENSGKEVGIMGGARASTTSELGAAGEIDGGLDRHPDDHRLALCQARLH
jgi:hypothetical protein